MGLMSKLEDKLGGHKEEDQSTLQNQSYGQQYESGSMQHPVGNKPTGTALDSHGNTSSTVGRDGYGSSTTPAYGTQSSTLGGDRDRYDTSSATHGGYTSGTQTDVLRDSHGTSTTHGGSDVFGQDKYGTQSSTLRQGTDPHDVTRGTDTYGSLPHRSAAEERIPMTGTGGTTTTTTTSGHGPSTTTSSGYGQPAKPMNPYSSAGQKAAMEGADNRGHATSSPEYGRMGEDPSVNRSSGGGILNQTSDRYESGSHGRDAAYPTTGDRYGTGHTTSSGGQYPTGGSSERSGISGAPLTSTSDRSPYGGSQTGHATHPSSTERYGATSSSNQPQQHHYGRDAAIAGGAAGAGGIGAHEYQRGHDNTSTHGYDSRNPTSTHGGTQYTSRDNYGSVGARDTPIVGSSGTGSRDNHYSHESKKAGHAYDAGYDAGWKDAMEHMKTGGSTSGKPSMMDKLNPKKDTDVS